MRRPTRLVLLSLATAAAWLPVAHVGLEKRARPAVAAWELQPWAPGGDAEVCAWERVSADLEAAPAWARRLVLEHGIAPNRDQYAWCRIEGWPEVAP